MTESTNTPSRAAIRTQADLESAWRQLMEPLGFGGHSVWLMMIDGDDRPLPHITQIEDAEEPPTPEQAQGLASMLKELLDDVAPGGRLAFLRSRPGGGGPSEPDRVIARTLLGACRGAGVPVDVLHLATDTDLVPLTPDDLAA